MRVRITERGFILYDQSDEQIIAGLGFEQGQYSIYIKDGKAPGFNERTGSYDCWYGTSKVTEDNAAELLADPELTELFEALVAFVQPDE